MEQGKDEGFQEGLGSRGNCQSLVKVTKMENNFLGVLTQVSVESLNL